MTTSVRGFIAIVLLLGGVVYLGCGSPDDQQSATSGDPNQISQEDMQEKADRIEAALAKLSPEDRTSAEMQTICPVTEMALGSMGTPIKLEVEGREVWICCPDCEDKLRAEPEKYFAKLQEVSE